MRNFSLSPKQESRVESGAATFLFVLLGFAVIWWTGRKRRREIAMLERMYANG